GGGGQPRGERLAAGDNAARPADERPAGRRDFRGHGSSLSGRIPPHHRRGPGCGYPVTPVLACGQRMEGPFLCLECSRHEERSARVMKVVLFTLGGTIASTPAAGGVVPRLSGADLLTSVPGLDRAGLEVKVHDFRQVPSSSLTIGDILDLAVAIREQVGAGADGVVVSQGTDTIEETVFLLDLLYDGEAPVVFTGAMRHPMLAGADGPANLLAAVTVAASPQARGLGCLVVFGDEVG